MTNIVAIRWNQTSNKKSLDYMIIDEEYKYLSEPKQFIINEKSENIQDEINKYVGEIKEKISSIKGNIKLEAKIIMKNSAQYSPSELSRLMNTAIETDLMPLTSDKKIRFLKMDLKNGKGLRRFKEGLKSLGVYSGKNGEAYIHHLWAVVVHATPSTWSKKLQKIKKKMKN